MYKALEICFYQGNFEISFWEMRYKVVFLLSNVLCYFKDIRACVFKGSSTILILELKQRFIRARRLENKFARATVTFPNVFRLFNTKGLVFIYAY